MAFIVWNKMIYFSGITFTGKKVARLYHSTQLNMFVNYKKTTKCILTIDIEAVLVVIHSNLIFYSL